MPLLNTLLNGFRAATGVGTMAASLSPAPRRRPPARLPVSAGELGENRRTADAVLKSGDDGLVPDIYAEEIATRGAAGRAYFHDFDRELRRRDPARAERIRGEVLRRLAPQEHAAVAWEAAVHRRDEPKFPGSENSRPATRADDRPGEIAESPVGEGGQPTDRPGPTTTKDEPRAERRIPSPHPEPVRSYRSSPIFREDRVDSGRAVSIVEAVLKGNRTFGTPRAIEPRHVPDNWPRKWVPEDEVDIAGYRLSGEAARLFEKTLKARPGETDIEALQEEIAASGLQRYSKEHLRILLRTMPAGKMIGAADLSDRRDAVAEALRILDWRNERARHHGEFISRGLGRSPGKR